MRWNQSSLNFASKGAFVPLAVPLLHPSIRADRVEHLFEVLARLIRFTSHLLAPMEVQVALVAVAGLVRIRKPGIEWCGAKLFSDLGCHCSRAIIRRLNMEIKTKVCKIG